MTSCNIIKDYDPINHNITKEFLYETDDWDLIECNYNLNVELLQDWYRKVIENFWYMRFGFGDDTLHKIEKEKSIEMVKNGYCGYRCGPVDGITMAWPIERYEPLPPPVQANPEIYPELNKETFFHDAKIMNKFKFGYFNEMIESIGEDAFRQCIITIHQPKMFIKQHIDSRVLKIHIPVDTTEGALFHFGKDRDRSYHMKLGKMYILNTGNWHGTSNETESERAHIITRVADWHIMNVIGLTN